MPTLKRQSDNQISHNNYYVKQNKTESKRTMSRNIV